MGSAKRVFSLVCGTMSTRRTDSSLVGDLVSESTCGSWTNQERKLEPGTLVNWWLGARMSCAVIGVMRMKLHVRSETGCFVRETSVIRMQTGMSTSWTA